MSKLKTYKVQNLITQYGPHGHVPLPDVPTDFRSDLKIAIVSLYDLFYNAFCLQIETNKQFSNVTYKY